MRPCLPTAALLALLVPSPALRADAFDHYTNPVLSKAPGAEGVKEIKQLTPALLAEHNRVLPNTTAALVIVQTDEGRYSKLLVQAARQRLNDEARTQVPILLIERFVTYKEGQERVVQAQGQNVYLFPGFHFDLDIGQVVPAALAGDLRLVADGGKVYAEPVGKARLYLVTKALPAAAARKSERLTVGDAFQPRYFNGTYKLHDDGRRSGTLSLKVAEDGEVTGNFYSDKDGRKYEVIGKIGTPQHAIQFTIKYPQTQETFQGWMFTGNGKAIAGVSRLLDREAGFYAVRVEDE
jgi:hypothetical protein